VAERLGEKKMALELREAAVDFLAAKGFDPVYGARPVKRAVQRELETAIAKALLRGDFGEEDTIIVDAADGVLTLAKGPRREAPAPVAAAAAAAPKATAPSR
jgi:ATP-dependent Clp protease ATP-binding subunit ClpB